MQSAYPRKERITESHRKVKTRGIGQNRPKKGLLRSRRRRSSWGTYQKQRYSFRGGKEGGEKSKKSLK